MKSLPYPFGASFLIEVYAVQGKYAFLRITNFKVKLASIRYSLTTDGSFWKKLNGQQRATCWINVKLNLQLPSKFFQVYPRQVDKLTRNSLLSWLGIGTYFTFVYHDSQNGSFLVSSWVLFRKTWEAFGNSNYSSFASLLFLLNFIAANEKKKKKVEIFVFQWNWSSWPKKYR